MPIWDSANLDAPHTQRELGGGDIVDDLMKAALELYDEGCCECLYGKAAETIRELRAQLARMKQERDYEC